jgi:hypothetical protein
MVQVSIEIFKLAVLSDFTAINGQIQRMLNICMKTSDFLSQFARDRELREARTNKTAPASENAPISLADEVSDAAPEFPMGYTRTRGVRLHFRVTNIEIPDNPEASVDMETTGAGTSHKKEKLVDKNAGPVLALMSVPVGKGKHQG